MTGEIAVDTIQPFNYLVPSRVRSYNFMAYDYNSSVNGRANDWGYVHSLNATYTNNYKFTLTADSISGAQDNWEVKGYAIFIMLSYL